MDNYEKIKDLEIELLDTSSQNKKYLIIYKGRYFEANNALVELISILKKNDLKEATKKYSVFRNKEYSTEYIKTIIEKCIFPIFKENSQEKILLYLNMKFFLLRILILSLIFLKFFLITNSIFLLY